MASTEDQELPLIPPVAQRVVQRAFCISAVVCRSLIDEHSTVEQCQSINGRIRPWLAAVGAEAELEAWEADALAEPLGSLSIRMRANGSWMSEGLVVLAWALGRYELPAHDDCVDPQAVTNALGFLHPDAASHCQELQLRPPTEIQSFANRAFALHWRLRQFSLQPEHLDFAKFAQTAWFGPLNIEGVALVNKDLSIHGKSINQAPQDAIRAATSIAMERHRAFNWLLGYGTIYSEIDTST